MTQGDESEADQTTAVQAEISESCCHGKCGCPSVTLFVLGFLGLIVANVFLEYYGIKTIQDHGDGSCSEGAFKWCWFIVISSSLFLWTYGKVILGLQSGDVEHPEVVAIIQFILSLGFAVGTHVDYQGKCVLITHNATHNVTTITEDADTNGNETLYIFMWLHIGQCCWIFLLGLLVYLDEH